MYGFSFRCFFIVHVLSFSFSSSFLAFPTDFLFRVRSHCYSTTAVQMLDHTLKGSKRNGKEGVLSPTPKQLCLSSLLVNPPPPKQTALVRQIAPSSQSSDTSLNANKAAIMNSTESSQFSSSLSASRVNLTTQRYIHTYMRTYVHTYI